MVTELRVHGVSGTPAEQMLDRPVLVRVAGDDQSGFFRPKPGYGDPEGPGGAILEGYRWGNLTSGAAARALWLLLLPFALANVAMWLHPVAGRRATAMIRMFCRIFALTITATYVLSAVGVSEDLVAWQCASTGNTCVTHRSWLSIFARGFFSPTGRRLALTALLPILAISLLWLLGRRTWTKYESFPSNSDVDGDGLAAPGFWYGRALVGRLRALHIAVAFATLATTIAGVLAQHVRSTVAWGLFGIGVLLLAICVVVVCLPPMVDRDRDARWAQRLAGTLRVLAIILVLVVLGYAMLPRPAWVSTGGLPGYGLTVTILFAGQCVLLAVLALVAVLQRSTRRRYLFGLGTPIIASFSLGVAAAFTAGLSFGVADLLDRSANPAFMHTQSGTSAARIAPPSSYAWASLGFLATVVAVVLVLLIVRLFAVRRLEKVARSVVDHDFPGDRAKDPKRAETIDDAIADARLTDHVNVDLGAAFTPLAIIAVGMTALALAGYIPLGLTRTGGRAGTVVAVLTTLGSYLVGAFVVVLILLGLFAYRSAGLRRIVGVLWDLGTFWPRAAHPLCPPCYGERAIPQLVTRTVFLAKDGGVILSGHSQGSVLVAATLLQLPAEVRPQVAMLTYGSPLHRLYARLFPAYTSDDVLREVGGVLGDAQPTRWINLWRDTDPIGGVIATTEDRVDVEDRRFVDPSQFAKAPGNPDYPVIRAHGDYPLSPGFGSAIGDLITRLNIGAPV